MRAARADSAAAASHRGAMQMLLERAEQLKGIDAPPPQPPPPQPQPPPPAVAALPSAPAGGVAVHTLQSRAAADHPSQQALQCHPAV